MQYFAALSPLPRYDHRFADTLGKWMLSVAVNARYFYPDTLGQRQSGPPANWAHDPDNVIPYEGLRRCDYSRHGPASDNGTGKAGCLHTADWGPYGTGQNCGDAGAQAGSGRCRPVPTEAYDYSTDRGFYGGTYVGLLGGAVASTDQPLIPQFDLNANDRFSPRGAFPTALLYNGAPEASSSCTVALNTSAMRRRFGPSATVDLYESTADRVIATGVKLAPGGRAPRVAVAAGQAVVVVAMPGGSGRRLLRAADGEVTVPAGKSGAGGSSPTVVVRFRTPSR